MKIRIISALIGIPIVTAALFLAGRNIFGGFILVVAILALREYLRLCGIEPILALTALAAGAAVLIAIPKGLAAGTAAASLFALVLVSLWGVRDPALRFQGLGESVLGGAYICYAMGCLWLLRTLPEGKQLVFLVLVATWLGDSAAYFVGSRWGKRPFAPVLSPKKTWAGAVGGLAGSLVGGAAVFPFFENRFPPALIAGIGLAVGVSGQLGDLFESLWKRAKGVKDSGTLIPGHGGILDRIDSLLLGIPVAYHIVRAWTA